MNIYYDKDADLSIIKSTKVAIIGDGKATFDLNKKTDYLKLSKYFIIFLS